jgi:Spy/CpxP family protein refolding chaperone
MIGFILGTVALAALIRMVARGRWSRRAGGYGRSFALRNVPQLRALFARLDTTPGQERAILETIDEARASLRDSRRELATTRNDLVSAFTADHFDPILLEGTFARHDERITALRGVAMQALAKVHEALDSAQREKLAEIIRSGMRANPRQLVPSSNANTPNAGANASGVLVA